MLLHRPFALAALAAAAAAAPCTRNYTSHANVDYNGGDLPNQPAAHVSTPAECAALCCANADCLAFSLNAGAPEGRACYLKATGYDIGPTAGVDSGCFSGACDAPPPPPPDTYFRECVSRHS